MMGGTATVRESTTCPNCGVEGDQTLAEDNHEEAQYDCWNENCSVDTFWAMKDQQ